LTGGTWAACIPLIAGTARRTAGRGRKTEPESETFRLGGYGLSSSEVELQSELNETGKVDRVGHDPEVRIVVGATGSIRRSKLGMVKEIEELRPEFDIKPLGDGGLLEHCEVEVDDPLLSQCGIDTRLVAKTISGGVREAICVEPSGDPCGGTSGG